MKEREAEQERQTSPSVHVLARTTAARLAAEAKPATVAAAQVRAAAVPAHSRTRDRPFPRVRTLVLLCARLLCVSAHACTQRKRALAYVAPVQH